MTCQRPTSVGGTLELLHGHSIPDGFSAWRFDGTTVVLPAPAPDASFAFWSRYLMRVVATATGTCPLCGETAGLSHDPETAPAAFRVLPVTYGITHAPDCPATFTAADRPHFDPQALAWLEREDPDAQQ